MDIAPCITLQTDMANLFDQYLFKDHQYDQVSSSGTNHQLMPTEYSNFAEDDLNFQGLQLPSHHHHQQQAMMTSSQDVSAPTEHSLADIFTYPIIGCSSAPFQYASNNYVTSSIHMTSPNISSCSQTVGAQPIYTMSELKPPKNYYGRNSERVPQHNDAHQSGSRYNQRPTYMTLNGPIPRYVGPDRRPSSTGSGSVGSSPADSIHTTSPGRESEDSDDSVPITQINGMFPLQNNLAPNLKRRSPEPEDNIPSTTAKQLKPAKKVKVPKKKKKRDPNEPQKPVSAYALFFRDTQAAIKGQNPNASFGEVSKIVASMWDGLDVDHKNIYKKKTEAAKKEYLKALAAYRASIVCRTGPEHDLNMNHTPMRQRPQQLSPLQKKSPLLTSLMDNNNSGQVTNRQPQYCPPVTTLSSYHHDNVGNNSSTIEPYPPIYNCPPRYSMPSAYQTNLRGVHSYEQRRAVDNKSNLQLNRGLGDGIVSPQPVMTDQTVTSMVPPSQQIQESNNPNLSRQIVQATSNNFMHIQGDNLTNVTNILSPSHQMQPGLSPLNQTQSVDMVRQQPTMDGQFHPQQDTIQDRHPTSTLSPMAENRPSMISTETRQQMTISSTISPTNFNSSPSAIQNQPQHPQVTTMNTIPRQQQQQSTGVSTMVTRQQIQQLRAAPTPEDGSIRSQQTSQILPTACSTSPTQKSIIQAPTNPQDQPSDDTRQSVVVQEDQSSSVQDNCTRLQPIAVQASPTVIQIRCISRDNIQKVDSASNQPVVKNTSIPLQTNPICLREGCSNLAVESIEWDNEYCSSECVVSHCRDVFGAWVAARHNSSSTVASIK